MAYDFLTDVNIDGLITTTSITETATTFGIDVAQFGNSVLSMNTAGVVSLKGVTSMTFQSDAYVWDSVANGNLMEIEGTGGLFKLNKYGGGTITGTEAYLLSTTATGNIVETPFTEFAQDNAVVHIAGTETITGTKTFPNTTYFGSNVAGINFNPTGAILTVGDIGASDVTTHIMGWDDNTYIDLGEIDVTINAGGGGAIILTPTSDARIVRNDIGTTSPHLLLSNSSTGDVFQTFTSSALSYSVGIDNSVAGDPFIISEGTTLTGTTRLEFYQGDKAVLWNDIDDFYIFCNTTVLTTGGYWQNSGTGDIKLTMVANGSDWTFGVDGSDSGKFKLSEGNVLGTNDAFEVDQTTFNAEFFGTLTATNLSGTNTGDQTSIVGITGTKAQFDTAVTDGNIVYVGDSIAESNITGFRKEKGVTIPNPVDTDDATIFKTKVAITITSIDSHITGTTNVVFNIQHASTRTGTGLNVFTSNITLTSTAGQTNNSGFNDATIPANSWVWVNVVSVSGTPTWFHTTLNYTED